MNKILMDGDKLFINDSKNDFIIDGYVTLLIYNLNFNIDLKLELKDNANLLILDLNSSYNRNINIIQNNNTCLNYIHSFNNNDNYNFNYIANIKGDNNINNIMISGINENISNIYVDGIVKKNLKNNELNEVIKVLNLDGNVIIKPMLHISVLDVSANHSTAISNVNKDELLYLNSKGIDDNHALELIKNEYIFGLFYKYPEFLNLIKGGDIYE